MSMYPHIHYGQPPDYCLACGRPPPEAKKKTPEVILRINLSCNHCKKQVVSALDSIKEVQSVEVDHAKDMVTVTGNVTYEQCIKKVKGLGKSVEPYPEKEVKKMKAVAEKKKKEAAKLKLKEAEKKLKDAEKEAEKKAQKELKKAPAKPEVVHVYPHWPYRPYYPPPHECYYPDQYPDNCAIM